MAVVSESMLYQERIAPSYVSSSGYYGYVPPTCPFANYESIIVKEPSSCNSGANEAINGSSIVPVPANTGANQWTMPKSASLIFQKHKSNIVPPETVQKYNNTAMETDQEETLLRNDQRFHDAVMRCQNNHCVIPEPRIQNINNAMFSLPFGPPYGTTQSELCDFTKRRGNRKRNSAGDPAYLIDDRSANFTKKSRQDGGNSNFCNGTGPLREFGPSALHNEPTSLIVVDKGLVNVDTIEKVSKGFRCRDEASNYNDDSLNETNHERSCCKITTRNSEKPKLIGNSYLDYEIMLMETHGCSAYHYNSYRNFDNAVLTETEF
ncbi:uncharacterized protein [Venturia canescens]|uniref:uncharacterized protein n=1 Tax=Venturia canescens TaxID=32260 RepID=UPI001C9BC641|nr:uncharacterized protein LOC122406758 [Venturia canescens]